MKVAKAKNAKKAQPIKKQQAVKPKPQPKNAKAVVEKKNVKAAALGAQPKTAKALTKKPQTPTKAVPKAPAKKPVPPKVVNKKTPSAASKAKGNSQKTDKTPAKQKSPERTRSTRSKTPVLPAPTPKATPSKLKPATTPKSPAKNDKATPSKANATPAKVDVVLPAKRGRASTQDATPDKKQKVSDTEAKIVKQTVKGRVAVDAEYTNASGVRVFDDGIKAWSVTMNQTKMNTNNNKYYIIQLLQSESDKGLYYVWMRWGRVGFKGMSGCLQFRDIDRAKHQYESKRRSKLNGGYIEIEIVYDNEEQPQEETKKPAKGKKKASKTTKVLDPRLKRLVELIFDKAAIVNTLKEIGYDSKKMPLGKLSKNTLNAGLAVLKRIEAVIDGNSREDLSALSGEFFSLIPHDFGFRHMSNFIIRTKPELKRKIDMIESLSEMKIASTLLSEGEEFEDPTLEYYSSLKCDLKPVEASDDKHRLVTEYITNTHASTHSSYKLKVQDIFEIDRDGEEARFKSEIPNRMLLWHGSRLTNWVGILSQGLRIAPPEAPVSGYMFGKGVYFADMVSKSANYCFTNPSNNVGILMLCEVAMGKMRELTNADYNASNLPKGYHGTKGCGSTAPPETSYVDHDGMKVPIGAGERTDKQGGLLYNEYIVYDVAQIRMKYLIKTEFVYRQ